MHISRLHQHDAASVDVMAQFEGLKQRGYDVSLHARSWPQDAKNLVVSFEEAKKIASDPDTIVLFHYCGFDRQLKALRRAARGKFIVRYHNVTPPKWFLPYAPRSFMHALLGHLQIRSFVTRGKLDMLMPCSYFSAEELFEESNPHAKLQTYIIFNQVRSHTFKGVEFRKQPNDSNSKKALFVSRLLPHKGLIHLVRLLNAWTRTDAAKSGIRLSIDIAGKVSPEYQPYLQKIKNAAAKLGVLEHIRFHFDVSADDLKKLYQNADVYLCPSEHEGFGVPAVEAQCAGVPVIALNYAATAEILGDGAVIIPTDPLDGPVDYIAFAKAVESSVLFAKYRQRLIEAGFENIKRFEPADVIDDLILALKELTSS